MSLYRTVDRRGCRGCRSDRTRKSGRRRASLAGVGTAPGPGAGVEPDLHRHARLRRIRRTRRVSGSGRSFTRRSSMPTTASSGATRQSSFRTSTAMARASSSRRVAPSGGHRCGVHGAGRPVSRHGQRQLDDSYAASLAALSDDRRRRRTSHGSAASPGGPRSRRPCSPGARPMASARATLRSPEGQRSASGGRRRRRTAMSAQGLAFTAMFVWSSNTQFQPGPPRGLASATYTDDFNAVKALGRRTGSTRTEDQTALAPFWEGNASVHWNQAANQIARANHLSMSDSNRLLAVLNIAMADTAFTIWSAKRFYGADPTEVTWRPVTAIPLADTDGNPDTAPDPDWLPLVTTPSHPEYPAGHPGQNGAAATVLLSHFGDDQTFTLTTADSRAARTPASRRRARTETTPGSGAACTTRARSRSATPSARRSPSTSTRTRCSGFALGTSRTYGHERWAGLRRPARPHRTEINGAEIPRRDVSPALASTGCPRCGPRYWHGRNGARARRDAGPVRAHDLPPRRRDVLPCFRGGVGGGCRRGLPARRHRLRAHRLGGGVTRGTKADARAVRLRFGRDGRRGLPAAPRVARRLEAIPRRGLGSTSAASSSTGWAAG